MTEYERELLYKEMKEIIYNLMNVVADMYTPTYRYAADCNDDVSFIRVGYCGSQPYQEFKTREFRAMIKNDCGLLLPLYTNTCIVVTDEQLESIVTFYKLKGTEQC